MSGEAQTNTKDWSQTRTLYVVLQGEFALYHQPSGDPDCDDTLRILAPYICDHEYKAGPWLTDWKCAPELPRVLSLENAIGDHKFSGQHCCRATPEGNLDIFASIGQWKLCPNNARLDITAPMPLAILPGLMEKNGSDLKIEVLKDGEVVKCIPVPPVTTVIPILVYKWYADSRPYLLDSESGCTWVSAGPSDDFQSLQIYASSPDLADETTPHAQEAFEKAARLLGVETRINLTGTYPPIPVTPPAGLSWAQVNLFYSYVRELCPCNPILRRDQIEPSEYLQNWILGYDPEAAHAGNCGPVTGTGG